MSPRPLTVPQRLAATKRATEAGATPLVDSPRSALMGERPMGPPRMPPRRLAPMRAGSSRRMGR